MSRRAAVYVRVSTEDQAEKYGIPLQLEATRSRCAEKGYTLDPAHVYIDDGFSGTTRKRPELTRFLAAATAGQVDVVVIYDEKRLARGTEDDQTLLISLISEIIKVGVQVEFIGGLGTVENTAHGRFMVALHAALGGLDREQLLSRMTDGRMARARQGSPVSRPPFGYRLVQTRLQVDAARAPLVQEIFGWAAEGVSLYRIAQRLNERGIPSPNGNRRGAEIQVRRRLPDQRWTTVTKVAEGWGKCAVADLLKNETYRGQAYYNRTTPWKKGQPRTQRPRTAWIAIPCDAIVSPSLWARAQKTGQRRGGRPAAQPFLLAGLLLCGVCGRKLYSCQRTWAGTQYRYYRCASGVGLAREISGKCEQPMWRADRLESAVWSRFVAICQNPDVVLAHAKRHQTTKAITKLEAETGLAYAKGELARRTREARRLLDLLDDPAMPQDEIRAKLARVETERRALADQVAALGSRAVAEPPADEQAEAALRRAVAAVVRDLAGTQDRAGQREAMDRTGLVRRIVLKADGTMLLEGQLGGVAAPLETVGVGGAGPTVSRSQIRWTVTAQPGR